MTRAFRRMVGQYTRAMELWMYEDEMHRRRVRAVRGVCRRLKLNPEKITMRELLEAIEKRGGRV